MIRVFIAIFSLACALPCFAQTPKLDTSIRRTNWDSLLAHDRKHFTFDKLATKDFERLRLELNNLEPAPKLYRFKRCSGDNGPGMLDTVVYLDINSDGREDAAIQIGTCIGGNGGCGVCILFLGSKNWPRYFGCMGSGYKFHVSSANNTLLLTTWDLDKSSTETIIVRNHKLIKRRQ
jgi:hypothetical protein